MHKNILRQISILLVTCCSVFTILLSESVNAVVSFDVKTYGAYDYYYSESATVLPVSTPEAQDTSGTSNTVTNKNLERIPAVLVPFTWDDERGNYYPSSTAGNLFEVMPVQAPSSDEIPDGYKYNDHRILGIGVSNTVASATSYNPVGSGKYLVFDCDTDVGLFDGGNYNNGDGCPAPIGYEDIKDMTPDQFKEFLLKTYGDAFSRAVNLTARDVDNSAAGKDAVCLVNSNGDCVDWNDPLNASAAKNLEDFQEQAAETAQGINAGSDQGSCYSAAGGLGWIICSLSYFAQNSSDAIYSSFIESQLVIRTELLSSGSDTYQAWQTFQTFANIAFVIMLIFVIFSQLTGVGIDNYGVKKILPKLIVAVLMINLSYIICQVLVDVSNILGASVKSLFDSLGSGISIRLTDIAVSGDGGALMAVISVIGGLFAGVAIWKAVHSPMSIVATLAVVLLTIFLAVLMLFVILAVRQAAALLLVVVSPLAFACYMLPNTKFLFDKWKKLFQTMLLLYPICGLVIGAGGYAGLLIMQGATSGENVDYFLLITGGVVSAAPIFFIPSILRNSAAVLGSGVNKVLNRANAGMRRGAMGTAARGIQNAQWYKRAQDRANTNQQFANDTKMLKYAKKRGDRIRAKNTNLRARMNGLDENSKEYKRLANKLDKGTLEAAKYSGMEQKIQSARDSASIMGTEAGYAAYEAERASSKLAAMDKNSLSRINLGYKDANGKDIATDEERANAFTELLSRKNSGERLTDDENSMLRSYTDYFMGKGGEGQDTIEGAIRQAERESGGVLNDDAAKLMGMQLDKYSSDLKKDAPGLYQYAQANKEGGSKRISMDDAVQNGIGKVLDDNMGSMNDSELEQLKRMYVGYTDSDNVFHGPTAAGTEGFAKRQKAFIDTANRALRDEAHHKIKSKNRDIMNEIVAAGRTPGRMANPYSDVAQKLGTGAVNADDINEVFDALDNGDEDALRLFQTNSPEMQRMLAARQLIRTGQVDGDGNVDINASAGSQDVRTFIGQQAQNYMNDTNNHDTARYVNMSSEQFNREGLAGNISVADTQRIQTGHNNGNATMQHIMTKAGGIGDGVKAANIIADSGSGVRRDSGTIHGTAWTMVQNGNLGWTEGGRHRMVGQQELVNMNNVSAKWNPQVAEKQRQAQEEQRIQETEIKINRYSDNARHEEAVKAEGKVAINDFGERILDPRDPGMSSAKMLYAAPTGANWDTGTTTRIDEKTGHQLVENQQGEVFNQSTGLFAENPREQLQNLRQNRPQGGQQGQQGQQGD